MKNTDHRNPQGFEIPENYFQDFSKQLHTRINNVHNENKNITNDVASRHEKLGFLNPENYKITPESINQKISYRMISEIWRYKTYSYFIII